MKSIRRFLIIATLATMILVSFVAALQGYRAGMVEAERLSDSRLLEAAQILANLNTAAAPDTEHPGHIAYQIWQRAPAGEPRLLVHSSNIPAMAVVAFVPGFDYANFNGYRWRSHVFMPANGERIVVAAERTDVRYQLAENVILEAIFPIVAGLPLSGLLIWLIIGHGLAPLRELSSKLQQKQHGDLAPVTLTQPPQELTPVLAAINGLLQRLARAFEFEKRFTADAAHELRTPISALKLQMHNLQQRLPAQSEELRELATGIARMQHLVEQILALYRATPEQISANFVPVDLKTLVETTIAENYSLFEARDQHIELVTIPGSNQTSVIGDRFSLATLILNLLTNASKYTPTGGHIRVTLDREGDKLHLCVEDDGPGIAPEQRDIIFQRFRRLGSDRHSSETGSCGLGLAIVQNIADLHGAAVTVRDSRFAHGACFDVTFLAATSEAKA